MPADRPPSLLDPSATMWSTRARALVALVLLSVLAIPPASAHADFVSSTPSHGAQVPEAPTHVNLTYNEAIPKVLNLSVTTTNGTSLVVGEPWVDEDDPRVVHRELGEVPDGVVRVRWRIQSQDGHITDGSFFFLVGEELPSREALLATLQEGSGGTDAQVAPLEPPLRFGVLAAASLLLGVPAAAWLALRPSVPRNAWTRGADRERRLLQAAALLLAAAGAGLGLLRMTAAGAALTLPSLLSFATTRLGLVAVAQVLAGLGLLALLALPRVPRRLRLATAAAAGMVAAGATSATSHSAVLVAGPAGFLVDLAHLAAAGAWAGGLAVLALVAPIALRHVPEAQRSRVAARVVERFSLLAVSAVGLAAAAGLLLAAWHVPAWDAFGATFYGQLLTVKTLLLVVALGLAGVNRWVLHARLVGRSPPGPLSLLGDLLPARGSVHALMRSVRVEVLAVAAVLAASAVLTTAPTAVNAAAAPAASEGVQPLVLSAEKQFDGQLNGSHVSGKLNLTLNLTPGAPGLNVLDVTVLWRGEPVEDMRRVRVDPYHAGEDLDLPAVELEPRGNGTWSSVTALPAPGSWNLGISALVGDGFLVHRWNAELQPTGGPVEEGNGTVGLATGPTSLALRGLAVGTLLGFGGLLAGEVRDLRRRDGS